MNQNPEQIRGFEPSKIEVEKKSQGMPTIVEMMKEVQAEETIEQGKGEMSKIIAEIQKDYRERMESTRELPREEKRILILDCSENVGLGPLTVVADERLNASNVDIIDVVKNNGLLPQSLENIAGIIITGSSSDIEDKGKSGFEWIQKTEDFVKKALDQGIPTLGVCFGIQMHADIMGREVPKNEGGRELGVWKTSIYRDESMPEHPIFKGLEFQKDPKENKESTLIETVGSHAFRAGYAKEEKTKLYGFHYTREGNAYPMIEIDNNGAFVGLQFHPEVSSEHGLDLLEAIGKVRYNILREAGRDPDQILKELKEYRKRTKRGEKNINLEFQQNFIDWALLHPSR